MQATDAQKAKADYPDCYSLNSPSGGYKHWCPGVGSVWTDIFVPPHNNPFTPGGWDNVIDYWANAGIDVSDVPPIGKQITPPWPDNPPDIPGSGGDTYPTTPPWPDYPSTPPEPTDIPEPTVGDTATGVSMGVIAVGVAALLLLSVLK